MALEERNKNIYGRVYAFREKGGSRTDRCASCARKVVIYHNSDAHAAGVHYLAKDEVAYPGSKEDPSQVELGLERHPDLCPAMALVLIKDLTEDGRAPSPPAEPAPAAAGRSEEPRRRSREAAAQPPADNATGAKKQRTVPRRWTVPEQKMLIEAIVHAGDSQLNEGKKKSARAPWLVVARKWDPTGFVDPKPTEKDAEAHFNQLVQKMKGAPTVQNGTAYTALSALLQGTWAREAGGPDWGTAIRAFNVRKNTK